MLATCTVVLYPGQVQLSRDRDRVETIRPGSYFKAGALVDPEHRRSGTAVALCDNELLGMKCDEFL